MKRTVILLAAVVILAGATFTVVAADGGPLAEAATTVQVAPARRTIAAGSMTARFIGRGVDYSHAHL